MISFFIGSRYKDQVLCDVVAMDACHLLLGRLWQYDRKVTHDGFTNSYSFSFNNTKIVLLPSKDLHTSKPTGGSTNLLSLARFEEDMRDTGTIYVLIGKDAGEENTVPEAAVSLVEEFCDVFPDDLPDGFHLYVTSSTKLIWS